MEVAGRRLEDDIRVSCNHCRSEDTCNLAVGYCQNCDEFFCKMCLHDHSKDPMGKTHIILLGDQMPDKQSLTQGTDPLTETCEKHATEVVKFFCSAHDVVGCGDCMILDHKSCEVERIQDISGDYLSKYSLLVAKQKAYTLECHLTDLKSKVQESIQFVNDIHTSVMTDINKFRKEVNDYLDKQQEKMLEESETIRKDDEQKLQSVVSRCDSMSKDIQDINSKLKAQSEKINALFVTAKKTKKLFKLIEKEERDMRSTIKIRKYEFEQSFDLQTKFKYRRNFFGQLRVDTVDPLRLNPFDMKPKYVDEVPVDVKQDSSYDCELLNENKLAVICDHPNNYVALINLEFSSTESSCEVDARPNGITVINPNTIAVCVGNNIQLFSVDKTLTKMNSMKLSGTGIGIAHKQGLFAVSYGNPGQIEIMDIHGKVMHTIKPSKWIRQYVLNEPRRVVFGKEPETVIVSDKGANKIFKINFKEEILRTFEHSVLDQPHGLYLMNNGVLLICNTAKSNILALRSDWTKYKCILERDVVSPKYITLREYYHKMYVLCESKPPSLKIFEFE